MDVATAIQVIGSLGFPIACSIGLFWYLLKVTETHKEETKGMTEAINNNTIAITKLTSKLGDE